MICIDGDMEIGNHKQKVRCNVHQKEHKKALKANADKARTARLKDRRGNNSFLMRGLV